MTSPYDMAHIFCKIISIIHRYMNLSCDLPTQKGEGWFKMLMNEGFEIFQIRTLSHTG